MRAKEDLRVNLTYRELHSVPRITVRLVLLAALTAGLVPVAHGVSAQDDQPFEPDSFSVGLNLIADGFDRPLQLVDPDDGSGRLFVVEQGGTIRILEDGNVAEEPFLDISDQVSSGSEQGLLSMALHPSFKENGTFFIDYTDIDGNTQVERWKVSADNDNVADPGSMETILEVDQPFPNHNGGLLLFGPDGYMYVGLGDGGSQGDPNGNGQKTEELLGSILRIDVDSTSGDLNYGIPKDNPFADGDGGRPEVWLYGFRNPWRFSFDRSTDDLYIGDVGQGTYEEIDLFPKNGEGRNFGWNIMEASSCYLTDDCDQSGLELPIFSYSHDFGCSVTGGYIYRGKKVPELSGVYLLADYCSGLLWGLGKDDSGNWVASDPQETGLNISSFAEDAQGELYAIDLNGGVYSVTAGE
jgi:glucose/arabinose dehydrogenase